MRYICSVLVLLIGTLYSFAQSQASKVSLENTVAHLASDGMKGRKSGSAEADSAARFIENCFREYGLDSLNTSYEQIFAYAPFYIGNEAKQVQTANIIGLLQGCDPLLKDEYIVIGAHYDHIGLQTSYTTYNTYICNGADDNASGTAVMLQLAKLAAQNKPVFRRSILFVGFSGEEDGLFGSHYFVKNPPIALDKIKLMVNLDMVGMFGFNKSLLVKGLDTFKGGRKIAVQVARKHKLKIITKHPETFGAAISDHIPFYHNGIPCAYFTTGPHAYYHSPDDDTERLDFEGMKNITNYVFDFVRHTSGLNEIRYNQLKEALPYHGNHIFIE